METIPLGDGDPRWVFGETARIDDVLQLVREADAEILRLAAHLGVRASWTGSGIEYHRMPGRTALFGCAEAGDVSFAVELSSWQPGGVPPWEVEAEVSVRCDAYNDCGMHRIEAIDEQSFDSPVGAARALLEAATWVRRRGMAEPLTSWRQRDTISRHA